MICLVVVLFFFSLCDYIFLDDGVRGLRTKIKGRAVKKLRMNFFSSRNVLYCGFCSSWKCFL